MTEMLVRTIGQSGISASAVGLGTWAIGGWMWGGTDDAKAADAIRAGLDAGITLIDTAPAYGLGHAETVVGTAIKGRRDQIVIATKCGLVWHAKRGHYFFSENGQAVHRDLAPAAIRHEVEQSLTRLGTDYIDAYFTHWQDPTTPVSETMETLLALKAEGKIRAIGASNATQADVAAYLAAGPLDAVQEEYSMLHRQIEKTHLPDCRRSGVAVFGYSVLALGLLSGRIGPERVFSGDDQRRDNPRFSVQNRARIAGLMADIAPVAATHSATPAQVAIAWTLDQPGLTFALCGARNPDQARENAAAGRIRLTSACMAILDTAVARHLTPITA